MLESDEPESPAEVVSCGEFLWFLQHEGYNHVCAVDVNAQQMGVHQVEAGDPSATATLRPDRGGRRLSQRLHARYARGGTQAKYRGSKIRR